MADVDGMALYQVLLYLACVGLAQTFYGECESPIPNCSCDDAQKVMECSGLTEFPVPPPGYADLLFQSCQFPTVSSFPMQYHSAVSLALENCSISHIEDDVFALFTNLKYLSLNANALDNVTMAMLHGLDHLETLNLNQNQLTQLPTDMLRNTPALTTLQLEGNQGLIVSKDFFQGVQLEALHLSDSGFSSIPHTWFTDMPSLKSLYFSLNDIGELDDTSLTNLPNLQLLSLDSCSLTHISNNAFQQQTNLETLTLSNNLLESLSPEMTSPMRSSLYIVHLDNNRLETLDESTFNWNHLTDVRLGHNAWHCDCGLEWVGSIDLDHLDHENVTCTTPEEHSGKPIRDVVGSLSCGGSGPSAVALGIGITILIICLIFIAYYVYRIIQNRRQRELARRSYNYSAVYKDTVESAPSGKTPPPRPPAPNYKPV